MTDKKKVVKEFEHLLNAANGNYQDFVDLTVDVGEEILALLKEQEAKEQCLKTKCVICPHCDNCDVDENGLLKEQEAIKPVKQIEEHEWTVCGYCREHLISKWMFCPYCGRPVKWE